MIIKSALATSASGSIGGLTANRGKGRIILGRKAHPTNVNSPKQQTVRQTLGSLMNQWSSVLTATQRAGWKIYAQNVLVTDALGTPIITSASNMFLRTNSIAALAGVGLIAAAPTVFNLCDPLEGITFASNPPNGLAIAWENGAGSTNTVVLFSSRAQSPTINFNRAGFSFLKYTAQNNGGTYPPYATLGAVAGQKVFFRFVGLSTDGRVSMDVLAETVLP